MRAVLCSAFTGPEDLRIGEIEEPKPAGDEILVDVHAASVSFMDHLLVSGLYQMRPSTRTTIWRGLATPISVQLHARPGRFSRFSSGSRNQHRLALSNLVPQCVLTGARAEGAGP